MNSPQNLSLFNKVNQLSNKRKFMIVELTQKEALDVSSLSKEIKIAFNKCSNYCTQLAKEGLIEKQREGKNTLIKSKVNLLKDSIIFN
jgi:predicted transcriptional regulator